MKTIKRLAGGVGALALSVGVVLALASPAQAEDGHYPEAGWLVQDTTIGPDVDWSDCDPAPARFPAALSAITDATVVGLTGPGIPAPPHYGMSIETPDLGLPVSAGDEITVDYVLIGGASAASEAVRLFIHGTAGANTDCTAPAEYVAAPNDGTTAGTLTLTVPFDGTIGTLGLVYDSSNGGVGGTVRFSNLTVEDTPVLFIAPLPEPTPGTEPTPDPSTDEPQPSDSPAPGVAATDELPVSGPGWLPAVAIGGTAAIVAGALALLLFRRKPVRFTAE